MSINTAPRSSLDTDEPAITPDVLEQAAAWFVQLNSAVATKQDREHWRAWRAASAENERAWQRAEALGRKFADIPPKIGMATLRKPKAASRRHAIRHLALLFVVGALSWTGYELIDGRADYRTAVGEVRTVILADGSRLTLNTASAVDIEFDDQERIVELQSSEILIETATDPAQRPFHVTTAQGKVMALGTRFTV